MNIEYHYSETRDADGNLHSVNDQPAQVWPPSRWAAGHWAAWYHHGIVHREMGPAVVGFGTGDYGWYLFGILVSERTHRRIVTFASRWRFRRQRPRWMAELDPHLPPDLARIVVDRYLKPYTL